MWIGNYTFLSLLFLFIQSVFIQNILLFNFLGVCSFIACSKKISVAKGLGYAVILVTTITGCINWFIHQFITKKGALSWINPNFSNIDMTFLEILIFISVIAAFVQILEIIIDRYFPKLYQALGIYLPLITVNCAILGVSLFSAIRSYPFWANLIFSFGTGAGWFLVILIMASIREKITYSKKIPALEGAGITFIIAAFMAFAFMSLMGIRLN
jgi:Na+-transporting NADH:ubiquinone oxidoreductase subunit E